ncbi:MAG: hypothetical protein VB050_03235 [Geobacteraceae bacterium]|nr:hypothetical protein [Geobacteraceae bacterium]
MSGPMTGSLQQLAIKKCGVGAGGTWNEAVACGAGDGILFLSGQAKPTAPSAVDQSRGRAYAIDQTKGAISCPATYKLALRYAGFELLAAMYMGTAGLPAQQAATTAYLHTLLWNTDPYGLMITVAKNMIAYIEEVTTAKVVGVVISGEAGTTDPLSLELELIGSQREVASTVNTLATWANVTLPTDADKYPVMFSHTQFRLNLQSGAALGAGDIIYPTSFNLSMKRKMKGDFTGQYRTSASSPQDLCDEPSNDGFPEKKLTLTFPKHSSATYMTALQNDTRYKGDITATGPQIASPYNYYHKWEFPHMVLVNAQPTDDQGRIKEPLEFDLVGCAAAPTGMTGLTAPVRWDIMSKRSTDPLA